MTVYKFLLSQLSVQLALKIMKIIKDDNSIGFCLGL